MPTYYATGVTASLAICDLQASLSNVTDLRMGSEQRADAARVQSLFSSAQQLSERPIGQDGTDKGVVQFVGAHEDMPLYMVEAGETLSSFPALNLKDKKKTPAGLSSALPSFSDYSPLTSLGATPTPTQLNFSSSNDSPPDSQPVEENSLPSMPAEESHTIEEALRSTSSSFASRPIAQALILDVELSGKSFLAPQNKNGASNPRNGKDLKLEIFINGQLADVGYFTCRRSATQALRDKLRFSGTRVHRQVEKPWIYQKSDVDELEFSSKDAQRRWNSVNADLVHEAELRGKDRYGDVPPSADFLIALAGLDLPERLQCCQGIGIVDVVITAGKGGKYGPETAYLMQPTRMDNPQYTMVVKQDLASPFIAAQHDSPMKSFDALETSPDIPLSFQQTSAPLAVMSPSPKKTIDLAKDLGIHISPKKILVGDYENAKGKTGQGGRTLNQRLGDLKKMSEKNQAKEIERLKEQFGEQMPAKQDEGAEPVRKKLKVAESVQDGSVLGMLANADLTGHTSDTVDPRNTLRRATTMPEYKADQETVLFQNRMDMALSSGASPTGHLIRRIASASPHRTPPRITKASALANSPTKVPVKEKGRNGASKTPTPQRKISDLTDFNELGAPIPFPNLTPTNTLYNSNPPVTPSNRVRTPTRTPGTGRGANRTACKWIPGEQTATEALNSFTGSEAGDGSCIGHAEGEGMQRQIGKARGGEFREEVLLVGIRFVVV